MATSNDQEYYENQDKWGEARYVSLANIIDNIMILAEDDSYFKTTPKHVFEIYGKLAIKEMNIDILSKKKAISITVPPYLTFPFPRFMTDWYRISVINECDRLTVLNVSNQPTTLDYLQDNEAELLYDCEGNILEGDSFNKEVGDCRIQIDCIDICSPCHDAGNYANSYVKENLDGGYFEFSPDLEDKEVVIEFITAGLEDSLACNIKVHHNMERAVEYYMKYNSLQGKRNVPMNEILFHEKEKKKYMKRAQRLLGDKITKENILEIVGTRYSGIS